MDRVGLLNGVARRRAYTSYLEIGCATDATFCAITVEHKVGVDPTDGGTLRMTSDEFFATNNENFDLVFIDGLHHAEQVVRDVDGALACLSPNGTIVLHDCLPKTRVQQMREQCDGAWTGDVWKAVVSLRQRDSCDVAVLDADWGLGVVLPRPNSARLNPPGSLSWDRFVMNKRHWLRIVDVDGMRRFLGFS